MNIVKKIQPKIVIFTVVKNLCILHEHVFVMECTILRLVMIYFKNLHLEISLNA